jgi:ABC-type branched-subunit amino acid transport system permease subunit
LIDRRVIALLVACAALWIAGHSFSDFIRYVAALVAVNAMIAVSLDILLGSVGLISIGHAGFVAIGAYTAAALTAHGLPFWATLPAAGTLATAGGLLLGLPSLRLTGFYLAIATLAFGGVVEQLVRSLESITGGAFGMQVALPSMFGVKLTGAGYFNVLIAALGLYLIAAHALSRSISGRAMLAVKDSEPAAQAIGFDVAAVKLLAFALSGFGAGVAGAFYAPLVGFIGPEHFTFITSVSYVAMAVVGGVGPIGAFIGAAFVTALPELFAGLHDYAELLWGGTLLLILLLSPRGLARLLRLPAGR